MLVILSCNFCVVFCNKYSLCTRHSGE